MTNRQGTLDALCRIPTAAPTPEPMQADLRETIRSGASCSCRGVEMGSYNAQIEMVPPAHMDRTDGRGICIDACLALEVSGLWKKGITTTGCCCGHNKAPAYIGVIPQDIERMKALGYSVLSNPCRPGDEDSFSPLSLAAMQAKSSPSAPNPSRDAIKDALTGSRGWPHDLHPGPAADAVLALCSPNPDLAGLVEALERHLTRIASLNDLEGVADADVESALQHGLYECELAARDALECLHTHPALASLK